MSDQIVSEFIEYWKARDFTGWKEIDVREDFIAPMLRVLGYSKNSVNDILREPSLGLPKLYHRIGRKEIEIDYIPTLRLKRFWLIEAKKGADYDLDTGDLLQAYLYAIHASVQARYIVLINGREIRLYDTTQLASTDDNSPLEDNYLLMCRQEDCETTFPQLYRFLGAKTMLASTRDHIISLLRDSLDVEIDEEVPHQLQQKLAAVLEASKPRIQKNARDVNFRAWQEFFQADQRNMDSYPFDVLLALMNMPPNGRSGFGEQAARRIVDAQPQERMFMVKRLWQLYMGRPHSVFRVHCVIVLIALLTESVDVPPTAEVPTLESALEQLVLANMSYWASDELQYALVHLDNTSLRVAKKLCMRLAMKPIQDQLTHMRSALPREDFLADLSGVAGRMIGATSAVAEEMWHRYVNLDTTSIWSAVWGLEALEAALERIPEPPYPPSEGDILYFQYYGRGVDILSLGTHEMVQRSRAALVTAGAPPSVIAVADMDRDQVVNSMPKPRTPPQGFDPMHDDRLSQLLTQINQLSLP